MAGELTAEEREARRGGIGGSDVGPVHGVGYGTPFTVWVDKVYGWEQDVTPAMQRGHDLEHVVADLFTRKTGEPAWPWDEGQYWSADHPRMFATLDYLVETPDTWLECKTAEWSRQRHLWGPDEDPTGLPVYYDLQAHQQMIVTGAERVIVAVLFVDTWQLRHYVIDRDDELAGLIVANVERYWSTYVAALVPPPITQPSRDLEAATAIPLLERVVELGPDGRRWVEQLADAKAAKSAAEADEKEAKAEIYRALGGATAGTVDGGPGVTVSEHDRNGSPVRRLLMDKRWRK